MVQGRTKPKQNMEDGERSQIYRKIKTERQKLLKIRQDSLRLNQRVTETCQWQ